MNTHWTVYADVIAEVHREHPAAAQPATPIRDAAIASPGTTGDVHLVLADRQGIIWHTIREPGGSWLPFGRVSQQVPGFEGQVVGCSALDDDLHVVTGFRPYDPISPRPITTKSTVRQQQDGGWKPMATFDSPSLALLAPLETTIFGLTDDADPGGGGVLMAQDRFASNQVGPPRDIFQKTINENPPPVGQIFAGAKALAAADPMTRSIGTHIMVMFGGIPYHSLRTAASGTKFGNVLNQLHLSNAFPLSVVFDGVACSTIGNELHVVLSGSPPPLADTRIWHLTRFEGGGWSDLDDVNSQIGSLTDNQNDPSPVRVTTAFAPTMTP
jgi:hypothetical protein